MKKTRKFLSLALALLMLISAVPMWASASVRWDVINAKGVSGEDIVAQARTYLGVPYTNSTNHQIRTGYGSTMAFDCSGFAYRVCRDVGLTSSRANYSEGKDDNGNYYITAHTQEQRYYGTDISYLIENVNKGDCTGLQAGDLLFFTGDNVNVSHVAIYSGNGTIIHSEGWEGCVAEHPINRYPTSDNWYFAACRLVEDKIETSDKVEFNGHYYQVFDEPLDWFGAKAKCESLGGHLVTITSKEEQDEITDMLTIATRNSYWLGGYKTGPSFEWITGEKMSYTNWASCQPDNYLSKEDCLIIYRNKKPTSYGHNSGCWNDLNNDGTCNNEAFFGLENIGFICEWESIEDIPTEPTPCKHTNSVNQPQLDPNCIDIGFTAGVYCNDCATWVFGHETIAVSDHKDNNKDGKCDTCLKQLSTTSQPEQPKKNIVQKVVDAVKTAINNFVNFFKKLLGR